MWWPQRQEIKERLDGVLAGERSWLATFVVAGTITLLLAVALYVPGNDLGAVEGELRFARIDREGISPSWARLGMQVYLDDGRLVQAAGPAGTWPLPGQRVKLIVRRTWYGLTYYRWAPGAPP